ncbi:MAG: RluA family pseudouridine synthase [Oscillospiraceae bacterium]|nr:RluA family pseudouridine synthase [Oscillospiraceae bacterium]
MEEAGIKILFEDNHLLCVIKPPGILSQGDVTEDPDMLSLLKGYIKKKNNKPGDVYLGLVHRLDRPVGGVMAFARTSKAAARLSEQIRDHIFKKTYYAVLTGDLPEPSGKLRNIIIKEKWNNTVRVLPQAEEWDVKNSATLEFRRIEVKQGVTLAEINLVTGKPHQIRAQFAYHGFPVIGDRKYKSNLLGNINDRDRMAGSRFNDVKWPALWAWKIEFHHPVNKEMMCLTAGMPDYYPWTLFNNY